MPMSLDRAIMLPHEFDKKEGNPLTDVTVGALHRQTEPSVEWPQEAYESPPDIRLSTEVGSNDDKLD